MNTPELTAPERSWPLWFAWAALVFSVVAVTVVCLGPLYTYDGFWHLGLGRDLIEKRLSPFTDHYSFTYAGETVAYSSVLFQILLYGVVKIFGVLKGFQLFKAFWFGLSLFLLIHFGRRRGLHGVVSGLLVIFVASFLVSRNMVRPELLFYPFAFWSLYLIFRARETLRLSTLLTMAAVMVVWVNSSSSAMVGYVLFGAFYIDQGIKALLNKEPIAHWRLLFGSGALIFIAGFLNPVLRHPFLEILRFDQGWYGLITEYQTRALGEQTLYTYGFWVLLAGLFGFCAWRRHFDGALILGVLGWQAIQVERMTGPAVYVTAVILTGFYPEIATKTARFFEGAKPRLGFVVLALLWALFNAWNLSKLAVGTELQSEVNPHRYPVDVAEWMKKEGITGNIINHYEAGGYLIWSLGTDVQLYIDGRTNVLYPLSHTETYRNLFFKKDLLAKEADRHQVDYLLMNHTKPPQDLCVGRAGFETEHIGEGYSLLKRDGARLPALGRLWVFPGCGLDSEATRQTLARELEIVKTRGTHRLLPTLVETALGERSWEQAASFIAEHQNDFRRDVRATRFAAWLAYEHKQWEDVINYLVWIEDKQVFDLLNTAQALRGLGDAGGLEGLLFVTLRTRTGSFSPEQWALYRDLLTYVRDNGGFRLHGPGVIGEAARKATSGRLSRDEEIRPPCPRIW